MSKNKRTQAGSHTRMPHPIGHTLRALARWGIAASLGASAGCASRHRTDDVSQGVPMAGKGNAPPQAGAPSTAGRAGSSVPPSRPPMPSPAGMFAPLEPTPPPVPDASVLPPPLDAAIPLPPVEVWEGISCSENGPKLLAASPALTRSVDYLALYVTYAGQISGGGHNVYVRLSDEMGDACSTSADTAMCESALAGLLAPTAACKDTGMCPPFAITTIGDEVRRINDSAELLELLGAIDSPAKAAIAAFWEGLVIACPRDGLRGTEVMRADGAWLVRSEWESCGPQSRDTLRLDDEGNVIDNAHESIGHSGCVVGRRPEGLQAAVPLRMPTALGAYFANTAHLEAASVFAFERLARELSELGAPDALVEAALSSAQDEIRHGTLVGALARRFGGEPSRAHVAEPPPRGRYAIALENAVEGCVRETYGALVAHHQAALASDPAVAVTMARIAEDETRHAELAWQVASWLEPQLSAAEQHELTRAQREAVARLSREVAREELGAADAALIGWPSASVATALVARLGELAVG